MTPFLEKTGAAVIRWLGLIGEVVLLVFDTFRALKKPPRISHVVSQMAHLGVDSLPIVALTLFFTGAVMTLQIATEFIRFGAQSTIGGVVTIAICRELGPVLVGVVAAGRVGAAITAEISTMKVTEQIDALRVMATSPIGYLIVPRMLACMMMVPVLTVFGDAIGVFGGWAVATGYSGVSSLTYMNSIDVFAKAHDIVGGMIKASVFGMVIAILGCHMGLKSPDGAEGVGIATTRSVVASIIVIFMLNCFLSLILFSK
ncbi:MAG: ABC transporter permease [Selenomonadaceae bacterium]|nr:ABC transporter permease [Selenomonadaceae bacterium]